MTLTANSRVGIYQTFHQTDQQLVTSMASYNAMSFPCYWSREVMQGVIHLYCDSSQRPLSAFNDATIAYEENKT